MTADTRNLITLHDMLTGPDGCFLAFEAAYIEAETWNGWANPHLAADQMDSVVDAFRSVGQGAGYDASRDAYYFSSDGVSLGEHPYDPKLSTEELSDSFHIIERDADGTYSLAGGFTFQRVDELVERGIADPGDFIRADSLGFGERVRAERKANPA